MSKIIHGVGKVFKKVSKFVLKVLPYALAAAAVIFTGGAALGILPTFAAAVGSVVGSLGLSTALTGALTGAVVSAGFGAVAGGVMGGSKGMARGALLGAISGGALGLAAPATFGITAGAGNAVSAAAKAATAAATSTAATGATGASGAAAAGLGTPIASTLASGAIPGVTGGVTSALSAAAPVPVTAAVPNIVQPISSFSGATPGGGGLLSFASQNPLIVSQALQGLGSALGPNDIKDKYKYAEENTAADEARLAGNYRVPSGGLPGTTGYVDPTRRLDPVTRFAPGYYQAAPVGRYRYNEETNTVEFVPVGQGG